MTQSSTESELLSRIRRHIIGVCAIVLLGSGGILQFWGDSGNQNLMLLQAACLKVGPVCLMLWLAWPELMRVPKWLYIVILGSLIVIAYRPWTILLAFPLLLAYSILHPRDKSEKKR